MKTTFLLRELWVKGKLVFKLPLNTTYMIEIFDQDSFTHTSWSPNGNTGPDVWDLLETLKFIRENAKYYVG